MTQDDIEVYTSDIDMYIRLFQEEQNIDDLKAVSQSVWNGLLMYLCRHIYKGTNILKKDDNYSNYDIDKVNVLCDYYIYLCSIYDKECSLVGFSNLSGISQDIIIQWSHNSDTYRNGKTKLSSKRYEIHEKLQQARENSLSDKLISSKGSPIGIIAALNHRYGWSSPYTQTATKDDKPRLSRQELQEQLQESARDVPQLPG